MSRNIGISSISSISSINNTCHNSLAYLSSINLIVFTVYLFIVYVISDSNTKYDQDTSTLMYSYTGITFLLLFGILSMYNKLIKCTNTFIYVHKFILLSSTCILLYFGFKTLHTDELVPQDNKEHITYEYLLTKDNNDLVSVLSVLVGIFSTILILCSY